MNPILNLIKKRGATMVLPLLLLTTACGEDASSSLQSDAAVPDLSTPLQSVEAAPSASLTEGVAAPVAADVKIGSEEESVSTGTTLPTDTAGESSAQAVAVTAESQSLLVADVPEPATLAGLAVAAMSLRVIKRRS